MARSHTPLLPDHVVAGRYRLVAHLAGDGATQVWEAHDDVLARPVAITVMRRDPGDDAFDDRYQRVALAARLAHPNVVSTFDAGAEGDVAFVVTELLRGRTLRQRIDRQGPLTGADTIRVGVDLRPPSRRSTAPSSSTAAWRRRRSRLPRTGLSSPT
jgi:serine/threonine-protein kinase